MRSLTLSSSCIFHYTKSFDSLLSILTSGLRFSVVREPYPEIGWGSDPFTALGLQRSFIANRVVCFCDIPLALAASHQTQYGAFAIGLSKKWAMANRVAPVRYVHSNAPGFSGTLMELNEVHMNRLELGHNFVAELHGRRARARPEIGRFSDEAKAVIQTLDEFLGKALQFVSDGAPFFKTYEGDDPLQGTPLKRFYDEREWRAASSDDPAGDLKFTWKDIRYVLCETREDCERLYERRSDFSQNLGLEPGERLWQKLRAFEEIDEDF